MRARLLFLFILLSCTFGVAQAQLRSLPPKFERGTVSTLQWPLIQIGWTTLKMSPGATIRDRNNRFITANFLETGVDIVYTLDMNGEIAQIVILTPEERDKLDRR